MKTKVNDLEITERLSEIGDNMAAIQQSEYELSEYLKTDEAQLSGYSTQQLNDEIARRICEPLQLQLNILKRLLDNLDNRPF